MVGIWKTPQKHLKMQAMKMDYPLKEIAYQAGVSLATVDRVVHGRGGCQELDG